MSYEQSRYKIQASHLERECAIYIRQSKHPNITGNTASTALQYNLKQQAIDLGWAEEKIKVIDCDQGKSATSTFRRNGFKELVTQIVEGKVGAIICIHDSRVARSNSEMQHLLRLCRLYGVLFIDKDDIYDVRLKNDRIILGLKGILSEVDSDQVNERMNDCKDQRAREGKLIFCLPIGLIHDPRGNITLDPNLEIQQVVRDIFYYFEHYGTARAIVKHFQEHKRLFPARILGGPRHGDIDWRRLQHVRVLQILKNPLYAGAYVYGRTRSIKRLVSSAYHDEKTHFVKVKSEEWKVKILNAHPGYLTWEQFLINQERIKNNRNALSDGSQGAARNGSALLKGMMVCGKCGGRMRIHYPHTGGPLYMCDYKRLKFATPRCQSISGTTIDKAVSNLLIEAFMPAELERALASVEEFEEREQREEEEWNIRLARAEYETNLARRRLENVEPEYMLVAKTYRQEWNQKQIDLEKLKREHEKQIKTSLPPIGPTERQRIIDLSRDLPRVWHAETTTYALQKRILRCMIKSVKLTRSDKKVKIEITWQTDAVMEKEIDLRDFKNPEIFRTDATVIDRIRQLASSHTDEQIAQCLNNEEVRSKQGKKFHRILVKSLRHRYKIPTNCPEYYTNGPRADGRFSITYVARLFNMTTKTINTWCHEGRLDAIQAKSHCPWWIRLTPEIEDKIKQEREEK